MSIVNNIFTIPAQFQRVLYAPHEDVFFLHCGAVYQFLKKRHTPERNETEGAWPLRVNDRVYTLPIDEFGCIHEEISSCIAVGRPGEKVSQFHAAFMSRCSTSMPVLIPYILRMDRKTMAGYGIDILHDRSEALVMSIMVTPLPGDRGYRYTARTEDCYYLPFQHDYLFSDHSAEQLSKDIVWTLESLFQVLPKPKTLLFKIDGADDESLNRKVLELINDNHDLGFRVVAAGDNSDE